MEMQIFHKDNRGRALVCSSKTSAISLFFSIENGTDDVYGLFDFQGGDKYFDASQVLDVGASLQSYISGYIGTDTMPPCTNNVCWYLYEKVFSITQEEIDYFKVENVESNYREANLGDIAKYSKIYTN